MCGAGRLMSHRVVLHGSIVGVTLPTQSSLTDLADAALRACGAPGLDSSGAHQARSPITGATLGGVADAASVDQTVEQAIAAYQAWRTTPGPLRGELIRQFASLLRTHKADLGRLVQLEVGKIESEARGEGATGMARWWQRCPPSLMGTLLP